MRRGPVNSSHIEHPLFSAKLRIRYFKPHRESVTFSNIENPLFSVILGLRYHFFPLVSVTFLIISQLLLFAHKMQKKEFF